MIPTTSFYDMNQKFQLIPISSVQVLHDYVHWRCSVDYCVKGIFSDSNTIFLWHESEDISKKNLISKISVDSNFTFSRYA